MKSSIRRLQAAAPGLLLSCLAAGCVSFGGDARSVVDIGRQAIWPHHVTIDEAAATPYASLGVRIGGSSEIMIVLATDDAGEQFWTSASRIGITTSNGRVVRTTGLGRDLTRMAAVGRQNFRTSDTRWLADFKDLNAYSVPVACQSHRAGDETIQILGKPIQTQRVDENCRAETDRFIWTFQNTYWIDPDSGLVWRSVQHVNPKLDPLEIEVLRPPA